MTKHQFHRFGSKGYVFVLLLIILLAWFGGTSIGQNNEVFFPKPVKVFDTLFMMVGTAQYWKDIGASFFRVLIGFVLSVLVSYPVVMLSLLNPLFKKASFMIIEFFRYLPIPVFIPLTILWFGVDDTGKIFIVFLGTFAQMIPMYYDSALLLENKFSAYQAALKWSKRKVLYHIAIPGSAPFMWDNSRICFGWAWTYLIIAELLGAENGLGFAIIRSQRYLATDRIFAYVITIGLIGLLSDRLLVWTRKLLFKWSL